MAIEDTHTQQIGCNIYPLCLASVSFAATMSAASRGSLWVRVCVPECVGTVCFICKTVELLRCDADWAGWWEFAYWCCVPCCSFYGI